MNNSYINQITLDCLINKELMGKHLMKQREKQINKEDFKFYKKRIENLFNEILDSKQSIDLSPDVKYAFDSFIKSSINYFKVKDNNDLLQEEYDDIIDSSSSINDVSSNMCNITTDNENNDADKLLMRSIKIDSYTLDKYVKRNYTKQPENFIIPKKREVDLINPKLKDKEVKKNINNNYESDNTKKKNA